MATALPPSFCMDEAMIRNLPGWARERLGKLLQQHASSAMQAPEPALREHLPRPNGVILIIEVEGWMCGALPIQIERIGYEVRVVRGRVAVDSLRLMNPILLIVGGAASLAFYRSLHQATMAPILALVPEADEEWVLDAFSAGVDDCQVGPISSGEIVARVRAILRRFRWNPPTTAEASW